MDNSQSPLLATSLMAEPNSISVVMPVFNHAQFLERSLGAVAQQTRPPLEVIVVDDCSTDGGADAAETFRARIEPASRLTVVRNAKNLGVNGATNSVLDRVRGDWICCTGADDWLQPNFIEAMGAAAALFPKAGIVTSQYVEFFEAEERTRVHDRRSEHGTWYADEPAYFAPEDLTRIMRRGHVAIQINASLMRTEALRTAGGYDPKLKWHADWFVAYALAFRHGLAVIPEPVATFRIAEGTFSGDNVGRADSQREVCNAILDKLESLQGRDVRQALLEAPAPFAPFVRHMLPALAARPQDRDLFRATLKWWASEVARGRRPGFLRRIAERLGVDTTPKR